MTTETIGFWTGVKLENLPTIAKQIWDLIPQPCFVALEADMGCGKTTLVRSLLNTAGVSQFEGSPTFALVQAYDSPEKGPVYHLDCYRIENEQELRNLGLEELFDENAYFLVEWPHKIETIIPKPHYRLYIRIEPDQSREITLRYDY
jgi:tRNA threonylcarbamoyladenosine biosynthesis protein TsaE